jgi:hypothetical protein
VIGVSSGGTTTNSYQKVQSRLLLHRDHVFFAPLPGGFVLIAVLGVLGKRGPKAHQVVALAPVPAATTSWDGGQDLLVLVLLPQAATATLLVADLLRPGARGQGQGPTKGPSPRARRARGGGSRRSGAGPQEGIRNGGAVAQLPKAPAIRPGEPMRSYAQLCAMRSYAQL